MISRKNELRNLDFWVLFMTVLALLLACAVVVLVSLHYAYSITNLEMLVKFNDPDYEFYSHNPAHWSEEISQYLKNSINGSMYPICCKQFGEGDK